MRERSSSAALVIETDIHLTSSFPRGDELIIQARSKPTHELGLLIGRGDRIVGAIWIGPEDLPKLIKALQRALEWYRGNW